MNMSDIALNSDQHSQVAHEIYTKTKTWDYSCGCEYGQHECDTAKTMNRKINFLREVALSVTRKVRGPEAYHDKYTFFYNRAEAQVEWLVKKTNVRVEHFDDDYILLYYGSGERIQQTPNTMALRSIVPRSILRASDRDFASTLRPLIHGEKARARWADLVCSRNEIERLQQRINYLRKSQRDIDSITQQFTLAGARNGYEAGSGLLR